MESRSLMDIPEIIHKLEEERDFMKREAKFQEARERVALDSYRSGVELAISYLRQYQRDQEKT